MTQHDYRHYISILLMIIFSILIIFISSNGIFESIHSFILFSCMLMGLLIHWIGFIPSFIYSTEKYYDLIGTIVYLVTFFIACFLVNLNLEESFSPRSLTIILLIMIWTIRLGLFLFIRVLRVGEDKRFIEIKKSFSKFLMVFTMSAFWVFVTSINALTMIINNYSILIDPYFCIGLFLWIIGFAIEVVADNQKRAFRQNIENSDLFISSGLWSITRHPNYLGEIILWFGISIITYPTLQGLQFFTLMSPFFVWILLSKVSGINILEEASDKKWGENLAYQHYKDSTPVLWPFGGKDINKKTST